MKTAKLFKLQRGFLLVIPLLLIVVIGFLGVVVAYLYTNTAQSVASVVSSDQAFYIAASGLESAKSDLIMRSVNCTSMNSTNATYTNVPLFTGYYTVSGSINNAASTLNGSITDTSTSLRVINSSGFLSSGTIRIDNEVMTYFGNSGNFLLNLQRGQGGTLAKNHSNTVPVTQNLCQLTSTGGVPDLVNPVGKRILQQQVMLGYASGIGVPSNPLPNGIQPTIIVGSSASATNCDRWNNDVFIQGSLEINNPYNAGLGCGIASPGCVWVQGGGPNFICGSAYPSTALWGSNLNNPPSPSGILGGPDFFNYFSNIPIGDYSTPNTLMYNVTPVAANPTAINSATTGKVIVAGSGGTIMLPSGTYLNSTPELTTLIINGNLQISTGTTIGSLNNPVYLIVLGDLSQGGNAVINGFTYVQGNLDLSTSSLTVNGAIAVQGTANLKNSGISLNFNGDVLRYVGLLSGTPPVVSTPEVFP